MYKSIFDKTLDFTLKRENVDVLLVIDHSDRELSYILLIQHYLKELGLTSQICSVHNAIVAFDWWRPSAVLVPRVYDPWIEIFAERAFVFILPSEHGNSQKNCVSAILFGTETNSSYLKSVDLCFCCGDNTKQWIIDSDILSEEKLFSVGHPNTDHWLLGKTKKTTENRIGLSTSLRFFNNHNGGPGNALRLLYDAEKTGYDGTYYLPPQHAEAWFHFEAAYLRLVFNFIDHTIVPNQWKLEIRPHPNEAMKTYDFLNKYTNDLVSARKRGNISEWLSRISLLFTGVSMSALDAYVKGIPVVSLQPSINLQAFSNIPAMYHYDYYQYFWQLENLSQAKEYVEASFSGKLSLAKETKSIDQFLKNNFHYPREKTSSELIAEAIKKFLTSHKVRKWRSVNYVPRRNWVLKPYKSIINRHPNLYMKNIYKTSLPKNEFAYKDSYSPWRKDRLERAEGSAQFILNGL